MTTTTTADVWVVVDAAGDWAIGTDQDEAISSYEENVGALSDAGGYRLVNVKVKVPLPEIAVLEVESLAPPLAQVEGETC